MKLKLWHKGILLLLCSLLFIGYSHTMIVSAAEQDQVTKPQLTDEFLQGDWISKKGFVCSYSNGFFVDDKHEIYMDCMIKNGYLTGVTDKKYTELAIQVIDENTINFAGYTAVRADSKEGKKLLKRLNELIIGKWVLADFQSKLSMEFSNGKVVYTSASKTDTYDYIFESGRLKILDASPEYLKSLIMLPVLQISEDTLTMNNYFQKIIYYRDGSKKAEEIPSLKSIMIGDWIYVSNDDNISKWNFSSTNLLTIDYFDKKKSKQIKYSVSADSTIKIGNQIYGIVSGNGNLYLYQNDQNGDYGTLYPKDSIEGKRFSNKVITMSKDSKIVTRTYKVDMMKEGCPELTSLILTLDCKNNLWLEDYITIIKDLSISNKTNGIVGAYYRVSNDIDLKNAKLSFRYNEEELPYSIEDDLVIVRMDKWSGKTTILKTWVNKKEHTVKTRITQDGIYYLADSYVLKGETRDVSKHKPTEWE